MRSNHNTPLDRLSRRRRESPMDALITFAAIIVGFIGLGFAATQWGVDSRDTIGDDHAR